MSSPQVTPSAEGAPVRDEPVSVELMNTLWADRDGLHDALATARSAGEWLDTISDRLPAIRPAHGRTRRALTPSDAQELRRLRNALRVVAADITDDARAVAEQLAEGTSIDDAVKTINAEAAALPARLLRRSGKAITASRTSTSPLAAARSGIAVDAVALLTGDHESGPLRACLAPGCVLYFVADHPRREWCSPACGNRARVARHYERTTRRGR